MVKPAYFGRFFYFGAIDMIEGKCTKCGRRYYGWILLQARNQICTACGEELLITEDGIRVIKGYSPFTAEEYKLKTPDSISSDPHKAHDTTVKDSSNVE